MSVLEVTIAMAILAVTTLGVIAVLTRIMVAQSVSSHQTVGRLIGESVLQEALLAGPPTWGVGDLTVVRTRVAQVGQRSESSEFSYQVIVRQVPDRNRSGAVMFDHGSGSINMGDLWEVRVQVWWNSEDGPKGAIERGTQSLFVSKLVYIET